MNPPTILECYIGFLNVLPNNNALNSNTGCNFSNSTVLILKDNYFDLLSTQSITNQLSFKKNNQFNTME